MRQFKFAVAFLAALVLAGCGGSSNNPPQFNSLVSFGDSLSDIGTYSVSTVKALGGGKYTVNAPDGKNWVELMASRLNMSAPCPAQTGLDGSATQGFSIPELAGYVKNLIVGKGAKYVTVVNLPDVSKTPFALAQSAASQSLINIMVTTFNAQLKQGLSGADVLYVDAYTVSRDQNANPSIYGITNTSVPSCDLSPAKNPLGSSLVCTKANVIAGAIDNYQFADEVHPTPYSYKLLADQVTIEMGVRGWM